jgi:hypothetical protein
LNEQTQVLKALDQQAQVLKAARVEQPVLGVLEGLAVLGEVAVLLQQ